VFADPPRLMQTRLLRKAQLHKVNVSPMSLMSWGGYRPLLRVYLKGTHELHGKPVQRQETNLFYVSPPNRSSLPVEVITGAKAASHTNCSHVTPSEQERTKQLRSLSDWFPS